MERNNISSSVINGKKNHVIITFAYAEITTIFSKEDLIIMTHHAMITILGFFLSLYCDRAVLIIRRVSSVFSVFL